MVPWLYCGRNLLSPESLTLSFSQLIQKLLKIVAVKVCPAEDQALVHVVSVDDALQYPWLQALDSFAKALPCLDVGANFVVHMYAVCIDLQTGQTGLVVSTAERITQSP